MVDILKVINCFLLSKNLFGTRFARLLLKDKFISPKEKINIT